MNLLIIKIFTMLGLENISKVVKVSVLLGLLAVSVSAARLKSTELSDSVYTYTQDNIYSELLDASTGKARQNAFVMVHTTWCGFCNMLKPKWNKLAEAEILEGADVTIGHILCDSKGGKKICEQWKINSYPTLLLFREGEEEMFKYQG
jgi:thiol-disulfide isomerase/thioredoxin